jgi:hypothetical protein
MNNVVACQPPSQRNLNSYIDQVFMILRLACGSMKQMVYWQESKDALLYA